MSAQRQVEHLYLTTTGHKAITYIDKMLFLLNVAYTKYLGPLYQDGRPYSVASSDSPLKISPSLHLSPHLFQLLLIVTYSSRRHSCSYQSLLPQLIVYIPSLLTPHPHLFIPSGSESPIPFPPHFPLHLSSITHSLLLAPFFPSLSHGSLPRIVHCHLLNIVD